MHYEMQLPTESGEVVVVVAVEFEKNRMLDAAAAVAIDRIRIRRNNVAIY